MVIHVIDITYLRYRLLFRERTLRWHSAVAVYKSNNVVFAGFLMSNQNDFFDILQQKKKAPCLHENSKHFVWFFLLRNTIYLLPNILE